MFTKRNIVYGLFIFFASVMVGKMGWNFSETLAISFFICSLLVSLELFSQVVLYFAKVDLKSGRIKSAIIKFFAYGVYILVFSVVSAVLFFSTELAGSTQAKVEMESSRVIIGKTIKRNSERLDLLAISLSNESLSGYGWKYQTITKQIDRLEKENKNLLLEVSKLPKEVLNVQKNGFELLANSLPFHLLSSEQIKLILFFVAVLFLQYGLFLLNPDPVIEKVIELKNEVLETQEIEEPEPEYVYADSKEEAAFLVKNRELFIKYANSMVNDRIKRLNGNSKCEKETGIDHKVAVRIRAIIKGIRRYGELVIYSKQGKVELANGLTRADLIDCINRIV